MSAAYTSNGLPFGGANVAIYRGVVQANASAVPPVSADPGTLLGTFLLESASPTSEGVMITRPSIDGGDGGWALVNGLLSGSAVIQIPSAGAANLCNGDSFLYDLIESDAFEAMAPNAEVQRWVIQSPSKAVMVNDSVKISCTIVCDRYATS